MIKSIGKHILNFFWFVTIATSITSTVIAGILFMIIAIDTTRTCSLGVEANVLSFNILGKDHQHVIYCVKKTSNNDPTNDDFFIIIPDQERSA